QLPRQRRGSISAQSPTVLDLAAQQTLPLSIQRVPRTVQVAGVGDDRPSFLVVFGSQKLLQHRPRTPHASRVHHAEKSGRVLTRRTACGVPRVLDPQLQEDELQDGIPSPGNADQPALGAYQLAQLSLWSWLLPAFQAQLLTFFARLILMSRTATN